MLYGYDFETLLVVGGCAGCVLWAYYVLRPELTKHNRRKRDRLLEQKLAREGAVLRFRVAQRVRDMKKNGK